MPLHPQAKVFLEQAAASGAPPWYELTIEQSRRSFADLTHLFGPKIEMAQVEDKTINSQVPVRVYTPKNVTAGGAIVYFHGGGWVLGDLSTHDSLCRRLAEQAECIVAAVDYRCAPEHCFPAAFDDCLAATRFFAEQGGAFGVDSKRVVVAGDSAGGNLAATVALASRTEFPVCGQIPIYPIIARDFETSSYREFADDYGLTRDRMIWFWEQYFGDRQEDVRVNPTLADFFEATPPAHIVLAEYDVLYSEGLRYAELLAAEGVQVSTKQYDGMLHGFFHFHAAFDDGVRAVNDVAEVARQMMQAAE